MEKKFIYEIPVIVPIRSIPHSQWGFGVQIDPYVAFSAREKIVQPDFVERFQKEGREIVKAYGVKGMVSQNPYSFIENSALISGVSVPGDAADLSLDEYCRENFQGDGWREIREIGKSSLLLPLVILLTTLIQKTCFLFLPG